MNQKEIASQFRDLARNPDTQTMVIHEAECMNGLLLLLDSEDSEVLLITAQALQFLSVHPSNQAILATYPGLIPKIVNLSDRPQESKTEKDLYRVTNDILENLGSFVNGAPKKEKAKKKKKKKVKEIKIFVSGMRTKTQQKAVERALLTVRGTVSVTMNEGTVSLFTNSKRKGLTASLLEAVNEIGGGMYATRVGKNGTKENAEPVPVVTEASTPLKSAPSYLAPSPPASPEDDDESVGYLDDPSTFNSKNSLTIHGSQNNLQSKFQDMRKKQQEQESQESVSSFLGKVSSFFW